MSLDPYHLPLIAIVGPTASGKTSLAIDIAKQFGGEIICADSRTIYKGMDIGTAKPSLLEQEGIPHWGLDIVNPNEPFSASDFKRYAIQKIEQIRHRGKIPILVGGTGLYVDSVIFDYKFGDRADENRRKELNSMTIEQLHEYCMKNNITLPENKLNKRYVVRNIERNGTNNTSREALIDNAIVVGISTDKNALKSRIKARIEQLFEDGVVNEAKKLGDIYGWDGEAFKGNVYRLARIYLDGQISLQEFKEKLNTLDWRLAKRQLTWLRRNQYIHWGSAQELFDYISDRLALQH